MKVALVSQSLDRLNPPAASNSIAIWNYHVARVLARSHAVTIYAPDSWRRFTWRRISTGLCVRHVPGFFSRLTGRFFRFRDLCYILAVACDLRARGFDVVHLHNFSQYAPIVRALVPRVKIVLHMHCEWLTQLDRRVISRRLRAVDRIVGCSDHITEKIRQAFPEHADRCLTIYNGVDPEQFNGRGCPRGGGTRQVLFVGRISPEKGIHDLVDAFKTVAASDSTVRLTLVGRPGSAPPEFFVSLSDDPKVRDLKRFYRDVNGGPDDSYFSILKEKLVSETAGRAVFTGHVDYERMIDHYRQADVVVNPSLSEAFGMSLVEAMVAEIPVVATKVGGMPEIVVDGETGILVEPGEPAPLAAAMRHLLDRADLRRQMGTAGRRRALQLFSWERVTGRLAREYERL